MTRAVQVPPDLSPWDGGWATAEAWSQEDALRCVRQIAVSHYENFPVFLPLFRRDQQNALAAVYAFARLADDFADEREFLRPGDALLDLWGERLDACLAGEAHHPVFVALAWAIQRFDLDPGLLRDLLDAFRQDRVCRRYQSFDEVIEYCRRSANPVGRIVLQVLGADGSRHRLWSDAICTALQLTNFWQDISVDARKDRIYVPREDLDAFGIPEDALLERGPVPAGAGALVAHQVQRTRALFEEGRPLLGAVPHPGGLYLRGVWWGGTTVLGAVDALGGDVLRSRPRLSARPLLAAAIRGGLHGVRRWRP